MGHKSTAHLIIRVVLFSSNSLVPRLALVLYLHSRYRAGGKESLTKKSEETEQAQDMACERTSTTVKSSDVSSHQVKSTSEE